MVVVFDCGFLSLLLLPDPPVPPTDPATRRPVERAPDRIRHLVKELEVAKARIAIPTPVLGEFLVVAGDDGGEYLTVLTTTSVFQVAPFDEKAAIEAAAAQRLAFETGDKRSGLSGTWQCIKVDRQIVAIAKTTGAERIYSDDGDVINLAKQEGLEAVSVADLPLPPPTDTPLPLEPEATALLPSSGRERPDELLPDDEQD
jgi:hypothetical protein